MKWAWKDKNTPQKWLENVHVAASRKWSSPWVAIWSLFGRHGDRECAAVTKMGITFCRRLGITIPKNHWKVDFRGFPNICYWKCGLIWRERYASLKMNDLHTLFTISAPFATNITPMPLNFIKTWKHLIHTIKSWDIAQESSKNRRKWGPKSYQFWFDQWQS